jgi:hypothetical protein
MTGLPGTRRVWWLGAVVALACSGGVKESPSNAQADASAGGGTSEGGRIAASGGSGEVGGRGGGTPGASGGTAGIRGTGGSGVDAGTVDAARECGPLEAEVPDATPAGFCSAAVAAACAPGLDQTTCERSIRSRIARAPSCCHGVLSRLLACADRYGLRCASLSDDVLFAPECASVEEEWDLCAGSGDNCTEVIGVASSDAGAACQIECDQYAADCFRGSVGAISCTCTFGRRVGHTFSPRTCDALAIAADCK